MALFPFNSEEPFTKIKDYDQHNVLEVDGKVAAVCIYQRELGITLTNKFSKCNRTFSCSQFALYLSSAKATSL